MQFRNAVFACSLLLTSTACQAAEKPDPTIATGLQIGVGDCVFAPKRTDAQEKSLIDAIASAGISEGVNLLGKALQSAGAAKTWHVEGARNFQASKDAFPQCIEIVRGRFWKTTAAVGDIGAEFDNTQKAVLKANGLYLTAAPDFFFEGQIIASADGSALAIRPVFSKFNKAIGSRALRGDMRSIAMFLAITAPGTKPNLDSAPAATIVLGKASQGDAVKYVLPDQGSSQFESSWFSLSRDQSAKPFTITAMLSETQDESKFLTFLGDLLSDNTNKDKITHDLQVLAIPSAAQADAYSKAQTERTADSLADERYGQMLASLRTCQSSAANDAVTDGAVARKAMRDFMTADQDPSVKKPRGTVTQMQIDMIDLKKSATEINQACTNAYTAVTS